MGYSAAVYWLWSIWFTYLYGLKAHCTVQFCIQVHKVLLYYSEWLYMTENTNVQGPTILGHIDITETGRSYCQCASCGKKSYSGQNMWPHEIVVSGEFIHIQGRSYPITPIVTRTETWCQDCIDVEELGYWEDMEERYPQTSRSIFDSHDECPED